MGSIFPTDHSGVWGILLGLVGLILFGITASLLMDGTFTLNGDPGGSEAGVLEEQEARLVALAGELERLQVLEQQKDERARSSARLKEVVGKVAAASLEAEDLEAALDAEREWIDKTAAAFEAYQIDHRDWLWRSAAGRRLESLASRDGKVYHDVVVTEVSAEGMRIRHRTGGVRIPAVLLPKELRDELLIDLAESQGVIRERREAAAAALEERRKAQQPKPPPLVQQPGRDRENPDEAPAPTVANRVEILTLHEEIAGLTSRLSQLRSDLSEARIGASGYGRNRSAPGSLETWEERVLRLSKVEQRAEAKLAVLKARLRALDPSYRP